MLGVADWLPNATSSFDYFTKEVSAEVAGSWCLNTFIQSALNVFILLDRCDGCVPAMPPTRLFCFRDSPFTECELKRVHRFTCNSDRPLTTRQNRVWKIKWLSEAEGRVRASSLLRPPSFQGLGGLLGKATTRPHIRLPDVHALRPPSHLGAADLFCFVFFVCFFPAWRLILF